MKATPSPATEWDEAWRRHLSDVAAVGEISLKSVQEMKKLITTLRAYRMHKMRCSTETDVDYGVLAELMVELERVLRIP